MVVSGVAIFVNSLGVASVGDSTLYTALKNSVAGAALLVAFTLSPRDRAAMGSLAIRQWGLLFLVALVGGSLPYALYFRGLLLSTPVTASLVDHAQFVIVAVLAAVFLGERLGPAIWTALLVLAAGLTLGLATNALRAGPGLVLLCAATALFAVDFVLMKHLLRSVPALTVMTFKMALGSAILLLFSLASGGLSRIAGLSALQWGFIIATGLILLVFTATSVLGLRHASATAVTAISAGSPLVTTALVLVSRKAAIAPARWIGLAFVLLAVLAIVIMGPRREAGAAEKRAS